MHSEADLRHQPQSVNLYLIAGNFKCITSLLCDFVVVKWITVQSQENIQTITPRFTNLVWRFEEANTWRVFIYLFIYVVSLLIFLHFLWLFPWQMSWCERWAGAMITSTPIWESHSSQQSKDKLQCACISISAPSFLCYLWNASPHISHCCRSYRTLPSHLINHAIELNATQQNPVSRESEVICHQLSHILPPFPLIPLPAKRMWDCMQAGSFFTVQRALFNRVHRGSFFITTSLSLCH